MKSDCMLQQWTSLNRPTVRKHLFRIYIILFINFTFCFFFKKTFLMKSNSMWKKLNIDSNKNLLIFNISQYSKYYKPFLYIIINPGFEFWEWFCDFTGIGMYTLTPLVAYRLEFKCRNNVNLKWYSAPYTGKHRKDQKYLF